MTIVSYAQNFEDVMLWRAFKDVEKGFYIDVGANHPSKDSVTKLFYNHGWRGINIEPELEFFTLLERERPEDTNLNVAVSSVANQVEFYVSDVRGWSTTSIEGSENLAKKNASKEVRSVAALSLDDLIAEHDVREVHFLKVDVEGAEKDVLESCSFSQVRPWVVVVEATKPTTTIDTSSEWEYLLLDHDYTYVYFDGLNKYYVANEHISLKKRFNAPPNIFDAFVLADHKAAEERASIAEERASIAEEKIDEMLNSVSWKITKPVRLIQALIRKLRGG